MLNKNLLLSKMVLHGDKQKDLAEYLEISIPSVNTRILSRNGAEFTPEEMMKIKVRYNLTDEEFFSIFFADNVS